MYRNLLISVSLIVIGALLAWMFMSGNVETVVDWITLNWLHMRTVDMKEYYERLIFTLSLSVYVLGLALITAGFAVMDKRRSGI